MGKKTERKKIGDHTYVVTQFGALRGREVLFRLTTMMGPALSGIFKGGLSEAGLGEALLTWSSSAKVEDFTWLCDQFAEVTKVEERTSTGHAIASDLGKVFDDHFVGKYTEMLQWLAFAVTVNFADFLGVKKLVTSALSEVMGAGTKPPSESISPRD